MLAQAAAKLGYRSAVLDTSRDAPAMRVAQTQIVASYSDIDAARKLAEVADVVTYEFENINLDSVATTAKIKPVYPSVAVLRIAQNRLLEKKAITKAEGQVAVYREVTNFLQLQTAIKEVGTPGILKTATMGYDGKGQQRIDTPSDITESMVSGTMIYEQLVEFEKECSVIVARNREGEMSTFPIAENQHRHGILDVSVVPARITDEQSQRMVKIACKLALELDLCGLLTVEMFLDKKSNVLVNELAPRPHNSGHYTLEACNVSQFEQLVRALVGLPFASTELISPAAMVNLMGELWTETNREPNWHKLANSKTSLHLYGKFPPKPGRKMGHITVLAKDPQTAIDEAVEARHKLTV